MPLVPSWMSCLIFFFIFLIQCAEACVDSSGDFYCSSLWYFWFGIFWFCIAIFIGIMCLVNRYNKKKSQVDILQFTLPTQSTARSTQAVVSQDGSLGTNTTESLAA
ncbi:uncharacterized protein [Littorina saxatilis]|uniref:ATP synthase F0 subunit 8 n=1 Tax=Littorina saxatilis TaxID=31220 RepID=A0AAN9BRR5_9CAEN